MIKIPFPSRLRVTLIQILKQTNNLYQNWSLLHEVTGIYVILIVTPQKAHRSARDAF